MHYSNPHHLHLNAVDEATRLRMKELSRKGIIYGKEEAEARMFQRRAITAFQTALLNPNIPAVLNILREYESIRDRFKTFETMIAILSFEPKETVMQVLAASLPYPAFAVRLARRLDKYISYYPEEYGPPFYLTGVMMMFDDVARREAQAFLKREEFERLPFVEYLARAALDREEAEARKAIPEELAIEEVEALRKRNREMLEEMWREELLERQATYKRQLIESELAEQDIRNKLAIEEAAARQALRAPFERVVYKRTPEVTKALMKAAAARQALRAKSKSKSKSKKTP